MYPYDFGWPVRTERNGATWIRGGDGIEFSEPGMIHSQSSMEGFYNALENGRGLTIDILVKPANVEQGGPARILSCSFDPWLRNFTIGQEGQSLVIRLRTTRTNLDGSNPEVHVGEVFARDRIERIVVTYDFEQETIYVNGRLKRRVSVPGGNFSNWNLSYPLLIGNERTGNRPWIGRMYLVSCHASSVG